MERNTFLLLPSRAHLGLNVRGILEGLGALLGPRGALGEVLEGSENEVEKWDPPKSCNPCRKGGGGSPKEGTRKETGDQDQDRDCQWDQTHYNVPKGTVADFCANG